MNKFPVWLNLFVLVVLLTGILLALPNVYGSTAAVQLANKDGSPVSEAQLSEYVRVIENQGVSPEAAYIDDGRAVIRFEGVDDQKTANLTLRENFQRQSNVALTLAPKVPDWVRGLGLNPMSLGLDLRGGVYVLLEVDMESAVSTRLGLYEQDIDARLRDAGIRARADLENDTIRVRLQTSDVLEEAREIVSGADQELVVDDGADGRSLLVRMSAEQIKARQDLAIEQNITTLRNRVNELGVAEPVVQRNGTDRIVVQLPGVQDPNQIETILTATATLEFRLVDQSGNERGSRQYPGRGAEPSQILKREVIASGDQIIDAEAGFSEGQPAVFITLDAAGGDSMFVATQQNVNRPMSTVFIETKRESRVVDGQEIQRIVKTEEIINTATIRGVFKNRFQISGLNPVEARDLALLLRAGALAAPVFKIDDRTIGPSLGADNIERGFNAIQIGFLAVIIFMAVYYRWFGMIANAALLSNLVFIVAVLS
ncbi:MAG: protein translocase subunit SecD, partial [Pseudomonadota bacterium]